MTTSGRTSRTPRPARPRQPGPVLGRVQLGYDDLAVLAEVRGEADDAHALGGIAGPRRARRDRLVVGVGVDGQEGQGTRHRGRMIGRPASHAVIGPSCGGARIHTMNDRSARPLRLPALLGVAPSTPAPCATGPGGAPTHEPTETPTAAPTAAPS